MKEEKKRSGFRRFLTALFTVILVLILAFCTLMYIIPAFETVKIKTVDGSADWMSKLPDEKLLSETVIPGTHDSASKYADLAFFSKCQALTIKEQLEAGYRYLDIRLAVDGESMKLMHGFTACRTGGFPFSNVLKLDDVLADCYSFLDSHPTETVIFAVKQEHGDETVAEFQRILSTYIERDENRWFLTGTVPTVGEARGKLVLLRRYGDEAGLDAKSGVGFNWRDQGGRDDISLSIEQNACEGFTLFVQDRYKYDSAEKWNAFIEATRAAKTSPADISLNFLSTNGSPAYGHPYKYARELNSMLTSVNPQLSGWIPVDFADAKIAEFIYSQNFS